MNTTLRGSRSLKMFSICVIFTTAACGKESNINRTATASAAAPASAQAAVTAYHCLSRYFDTSLQKEALWSESFIAELTDSKSVVKKFGVSPNGTWYASLSWNESNETTDGVAAQVFEAESGKLSAAVYELGATRLHVLYMPSKTQTLTFACNLAP